MTNIRQAVLSDASEILDVTHKAFTLYKNDLHSTYTVPGLTETVEKVKDDIRNHHVYVAVSGENEKIMGSIRMKTISAELAYIYRFGVIPEDNNTGIGSDLLKTVIDLCEKDGLKAIALHTNSRYYKLARYYYGKQFFVHSTSTAKGYIRALFIKELKDAPYDIAPAFEL